MGLTLGVKQGKTNIKIHHISNVNQSIKITLGSSMNVIH